MTDAVEKLFSMVGIGGFVEFGFRKALELKSYFAEAAFEETDSTNFLEFDLATSFSTVSTPNGHPLLVW